MLRGRLRTTFLLLAVLLPWPLRRKLYVRFLGWRIHRTARVGRSYIDARQVSIDRGAWIGHFNVVRGVPLFHVGEEASISMWNWFTAAPEFTGPPPNGGFRGLKLDPHAFIVSRHYLDCVGGITIGRYAALGGVRSTLLTHWADTSAGLVRTAPIVIGERSLISSDVKITPGAVVPARSVVAMGAVVASGLEEEGALYGGVPAKLLRRNVDTGGWFARPGTDIPVDPAENSDARS